MALSIGVSSGSKINVGGHTVVVKAVTRPNLMVLVVDEDGEFIVSDQARTEILKDVFVFAGQGPGGSGNRLAFEAPREIGIHRMEHETK